jgi:methyl-accepting chemotaxis protein
MLKNMSIRKRILLIMAVGYVFSLAGVIGVGYLLLEQDTKREAAEKTELFVSVMTANQEYMAKFVRPDLLELIEDEYFPEASVGAVMMAKTAKLLSEKYPEYIFRLASHNPLNQDSLADAFEKQLIAGFNNGDYESWEGFTVRDGKSFYASAAPIEARSSCIWCHDTPEAAHPDMVEEYGRTSGYGYEEGDIVGTRVVYVPTEAAKQLTMQKLGALAGAVSVLFFLALLIIDVTIVRSVVKPIENIVEVAGDISRGKMGRSFDVDTNDEIKLLADAFNRMKVSLEKAMDILRK